MIGGNVRFTIPERYQTPSDRLHQFGNRADLTVPRGPGVEPERLACGA